MIGSSISATDAAPGRHVILLTLADSPPQPVQWTVLLEVMPGTAANAPIRFDAWLERDDEGQSGLSRQHPPPLAIDRRDLRCTVGTLSCAEDAIVVGAYSTFFSAPAPWGLSGHGPSRRGTIKKPDIAAPGHFVTLMRSRQGAAPKPMAYTSGTSIAAPFVTGTIACVYERAPQAKLKDIRDALTETARPLSDTPGWCGDLGYGCLNPPAVLARFP